MVQSEDDFAVTFMKAFYYMSAAIDSRYVLSMEGYFHLLEHEELNEARRSSRNALRVAIAALVISGILSAVSIFVQLAPSVWLP